MIHNVLYTLGLIRVSGKESLQNMLYTQKILLEIGESKDFTDHDIIKAAIKKLNEVSVSGFDDISLILGCIEGLESMISSKEVIPDDDRNE